MKRVLITIFAMLLASFNLFAYDIAVPNSDGVTIYYNWANSDKSELAVTYYLYDWDASWGQGPYFSNYSGNVVIPKSVNYEGITYIVTSIGKYAFYSCSGLTSITIPNSVTSIGGWAFYNCSGLTSVHISDLVAWCNIKFNDLGNPLYYAHHLYIEGKEIKKLEIPDGIASIGSYTFCGCSGLTSVTIPNSVTSIDDSAFYGCSGLTSFTIPDGVTSIGNSAFSGCSGLTSVTIPNSVTSIGIYAFYGCSGLTSVHISDLAAWCNIKFNCYEDNPLSYARHLYIEGKEINKLEIPNGVTSIGSYTFIGCYDLTSVTIPDGVTSIGSYAFCSCSGLTSVNIPDGVTSIGEYAFYRCSGLTSLNIPDGVTSIGEYAFYSCYGLTSITIPNSVTSIGNCAFKDTGWYNLQGDGILYLDNWLIGYKGEKPIGELVITDGTKGIAGSAFYNFSGLTSVTIPNSVTFIGDRAFSGCSGLTSVTIPNSVTSIGDYAFSGCSGLTSVTIPNSVTCIGIDVFSYCSGLTSVTIGNSVTSIGSYAFYKCSGLTSLLSLNNTPPTCDSGLSAFYNVDKENCVLWVPKGSAVAYRKANRWKDFQNIKEVVDGDVNLDEKVNRNDQNALVAHIMGEKPEGFYEGLADLNGDDDVNAADVVTLIDVIGSKGLSTETEFSYDNVDGSLVVSSLTCTLNNERDEAILLTRCELYSNGSLLRTKSYSSNPVSVVAGGNKSCTFENLSKPENSTDFTVCWHYTVNDESFVYRCPLTD